MSRNPRVIYTTGNRRRTVRAKKSISSGSHTTFSQRHSLPAVKKQKHQEDNTTSAIAQDFVVQDFPSDPEMDSDEDLEDNSGNPAHCPVRGARKRDSKDSGDLTTLLDKIKNEIGVELNKFLDEFLEENPAVGDRNKESCGEWKSELQKYISHRWSDSELEVFYALVKEGLLDGHARKDLVKECASKCNKTETMVLERIKYEKKLSVKPGIVPKTGYQLAERSIARTGRLYLVDHLKKAASAWYKKNKNLYDEKMESFRMSEQFSEAKDVELFRKIKADFHKSSQKLRDKFKVQSVYMLFGPAENSNENFQLQNGGIEICGSPEAFKIIKHHEVLKDRLCTCVSELQSAIFETKGQSDKAKKNERSERNAAYTEMIATKWKTEVPEVGFSKKAGIFPNLKGAKCCVKPLVEAVHLPLGVTRVDRFAVMSAFEVEQLIQYKDNWQFRKLDLDLKYVLKYINSVHLNAHKDWTQRKAEHDSLGYNDQTVELHKVERPPPKLTVKKIRNEKTENPFSDWGQYLVEFMEDTGISQDMVYQMIKDALAIKRLNVDDISRLFEKHDFLKEATTVEITKEKHFWDYIMPSIYRECFTSSFDWEKALRQYPDGEFQALVELESRVCSEVCHFIREEGDSSHCCFCGTDCECPPYVLKNSDTGQYCVMIAGYQLTSTCILMEAVKIGVALYHNFFLHYSLHGKPCNMLHILSRSFKLGCHDKCINFLSHVSDVLKVTMK